MQKLFSLKLISRNPSKISAIPFRSNLLPRHRASVVPPPPHYRVFSLYNTCSHPLLRAPTICSTKVLSNSALSKQFLPNAILKLKVPSKFLGGNGLFRAQFSRQRFQFHQPISYRNTWQSWLRRRLTTDGLVIGLIVTNVAVFLLWRVADRKFMMQNFMIQLDNFKSGRFHTMITYAFSHFEVGHIVTNMIGLYFFGKSIGHNFGPEYLLKLYLAGALVGSAFYLIQHTFLAVSSKDRRLFEQDPSRVPGLGASGAVNAIMLLDIFLFPKKTIYLEFILPVPAILVGIFIIGHDIMRMMEGNSQISGSVHLGGAVVAAIAWARLRKGRF